MSDIKTKLILFLTVAAAAIICGCVYPSYDGNVADIDEQQSVWQYLKVYSIFHDRLPPAPGSMTPYDMFIAINDSLGSGRYTEYLDDRPGGGAIFDPDTEFDDPLELTPSTVYFYLPEFSDTALWVFQRSLRTLSRYQNIIIDVRDNGGGLLKVTDTILGELLPRGTPYIKTRYRNYNSRKYAGETLQGVDSTSTARPELLGKRIAVLMNGYSASASEILAAGLKDGAGAYLIGGKSYGKGIGQVIISRDGRKRLSITFLEISGLTERTGKYHRTGIEPDPVPAATAAYVDAHRPNPQQQTVIRLIISGLKAKYPDISETYLQQYREELVRWYREPYYALKILEPEFVFDDEAGGGDDEDDVVIGGGDVVDNDGMGKLRGTAFRGGATSIDRAAARVHGARAKWRPMGAVIVDGKYE
jgi:hypothetical protein